MWRQKPSSDVRFLLQTTQTYALLVWADTMWEEVYYVDHYNAVLTAVTVKINILVWEHKYSARIFHINIPPKYSTYILGQNKCVMIFLYVVW